MGQLILYKNFKIITNFFYILTIHSYILQDLWDIRIAKLRSSVDLFIKEGRVQASLNHLTPLEINSVRPVFPDTLDALMTLHDVSCDKNIFMPIYLFKLN